MKKIDETKYKKFEYTWNFDPAYYPNVVEFNSIEDLKSNNLSKIAITISPGIMEDIEKTIQRKNIEFYNIKREYVELNHVNDYYDGYDEPAHYKFTLTGWILMTEAEQKKAAAKKERQDAKAKALKEAERIAKEHLKATKEKEELELAKKLLKKYKDKL